METTFHPEPNVHDWLTSRGAQPDLMVVNGGLHRGHGDPFYDHNRMYDKGVRKGLLALGSAIERRGREWRTHVVVVSSTHNGMCSEPPWNDSKPWDTSGDCSWAGEQRTYEAMREAVASIGTTVGTHAQRHVSYIPFHTLAGSDACGFSTRFPVVAYAQGTDAWNARPRPIGTTPDCHAGWGMADPHPMGGGYLHLLELLSIGLLMRLRHCDPPQHVAAIQGSTTLVRSIEVWERARARYEEGIRRLFPRSQIFPTRLPRPIEPRNASHRPRNATHRKQQRRQASRRVPVKRGNESARPRATDPLTPDA